MGKNNLQEKLTIFKDTLLEKYAPLPLLNVAISESKSTYDFDFLFALKYRVEMPKGILEDAMFNGTVKDKTLLARLFFVNLATKLGVAEIKVNYIPEAEEIENGIKFDV